MKKKKVAILFEEFCWNADKTAGFKLIVRQRETQPPQLGLLAMHTESGDSGKMRWKNLGAGCFRSMIALRNGVEKALQQGEKVVEKAKTAKESPDGKGKAATKKKAEAKKDMGKAKVKVINKHTHPSGKIIRRNPEKVETVLQAAA